MSAHDGERMPLHRELARLKQYKAAEPSVTATIFGMAPLRESAPDLFVALIERYGQLLDSALEQQELKVDHRITNQLQSFADRLGLLNAGPRDVVEIHGAALQRKSQQAPSAKVQAYVQEGRLLILELMGHLVSFYRNIRQGMPRHIAPRETTPRSDHA